MTKLNKFFLATLLLPVFAQAQVDINVFPGHQPYVQLGKNLVWGSVGVGGANNYFIFSPLNPDQRYCGFIINNNPTSAHSYTLSAWQTGDPNQSTFLNNISGRWIQDTVQGNSGLVNALSTVSFYVHANAAARIAISLTASTTQAGNPDTLDFFAVQTTSESCGPVQQGISQTGVNTSIATYSAFASFVPAAAATDVFTICGSASKMVSVTNVSFSIQATSAASVTIFLLKRVTADSGGTSTASSIMKHDSFDANATAVVLSYTANPASLGTSGFGGREVAIEIPSTATPAFSSQPILLTFGNASDKPIILHGVNECAVLSQNGATVTGQSNNIWVEWTEQ